MHGGVTLTERRAAGLCGCAARVIELARSVRGVTVVLLLVLLIPYWLGAHRATRRRREGKEGERASSSLDREHAGRTLLACVERGGALY